MNVENKCIIIFVIIIIICFGIRLVENNYYFKLSRCLAIWKKRFGKKFEILLTVHVRYNFFSVGSIIHPIFSRRRFSEFT